MPDLRLLTLALKPALAAAGAILLTIDRYARSPQWPRLREVALTALGVLAFAAWWNFGSFHFGGVYVHYHELFHYYLGAKYSRELGYTRLYDCVAAAEIDRGRRYEVARRWTRNLVTNELQVGSPVLKDLSICRSHFTEPRWQEFVHDVEWFRGQFDNEKWLGLQTDHGFNASPAWLVLGRPLANTGPVSHERILLLALIDPVLLVCLWAVVWWTFGWQVTAVALLWWGTNFPARFTFIGGAFLRQDWLLLTVLGVVLARRSRWAASGFTLTWATLLRVFPLFFAAAFGIHALIALARRGRPALAPLWKFALGSLIGATLLIGASLVTMGGVSRGVQAWTEFAANTRKHSTTRASNHLGLEAVLSFDPSTRAAVVRDQWVESPWDTWIAARDRVFRARRGLYWALAIAFLALFARASSRIPAWSAVALGATLIPIFLDLADYYYGFFLVIAFLWPGWRLAGIGLAMVSTLSGAVAGIWPQEDDRSVLISLALVIFSVVLTWAIAFSRADSPDQGVELQATG